MSELMSPQQINDLRSRVLAGETISEEEMARAVKTISAGRTLAMTSGKVTRKKAKTPEQAQAELSNLLNSIGL